MYEYSWNGARNVISVLTEIMFDKVKRFQRIINWNFKSFSAKSEL